MNVFRLIGDLSHLLAIIILLRKIWITRSCAAYQKKLRRKATASAVKEGQSMLKKNLSAVRIESELPKNKQVECKVHSYIKEESGEVQAINKRSFYLLPLHRLATDLSFDEILEWDEQLRFLEGISGKSQILFAIVYTTRYLDLVTTYVSMYNTVMKLVFIVASYATCYLIYIKFKATYDHNHDTFRVEFLLAPAVVLALLINHDFTFLEILWTFSIYLESVAILPQLFMVSKTGEAESITSHYLFCLGSYRGLYILNWVYRYITENTYDLIAIVAGIVQTVLYCDFFYLYITKVLRGKKLQLPA